MVGMFHLILYKLPCIDLPRPACVLQVHHDDDDGVSLASGSAAPVHATAAAPGPADPETRAPMAGFSPPGNRRLCATASARGPPRALRPPRAFRPRSAAAAATSRWCGADTRTSKFAWLHGARLRVGGRLPGLLLPPKLGAWPSVRAVLRGPRLALYLDELLKMRFANEPPPPPRSPPRAAAAGAGPGAAPAPGAGRGAAAVAAVAAVAADPAAAGPGPAAARARAARLCRRDGRALRRTRNKIGVDLYKSYLRNKLPY